MCTMPVSPGTHTHVDRAARNKHTNSEIRLSHQPHRASKYGATLHRLLLDVGPMLSDCRDIPPLNSLVPRVARINAEATAISSVGEAKALREVTVAVVGLGAVTAEPVAFLACDACHPAALHPAFSLWMALTYALWLAATRVRAAGASVRVEVVGQRREPGWQRRREPKLARELQRVQQLERERKVKR